MLGNTASGGSNNGAPIPYLWSISSLSIQIADFFSALVESTQEIDSLSEEIISNDSLSSIVDPILEGINADFPQVAEFINRDLPDLQLSQVELVNVIMGLGITIESYQQIIIDSIQDNINKSIISASENENSLSEDDIRYIRESTKTILSVREPLFKLLNAILDTSETSYYLQMINPDKIVTLLNQTPESGRLLEDICKVIQNVVNHFINDPNFIATFKVKSPEAANSMLPGPSLFSSEQIDSIVLKLLSLSNFNAITKLKPIIDMQVNILSDYNESALFKAVLEDKNLLNWFYPPDSIDSPPTYKLYYAYKSISPELSAILTVLEAKIEAAHHRFLIVENASVSLPITPLRNIKREHTVTFTDTLTDTEKAEKRAYYKG